MLLRAAPANPDLVAVLLDHHAALQAMMEGPGGPWLLEAALTYIYTVNAGQIGEHDLDPLYDKLGPKAREVAVTIMEHREAKGLAQGRVEGRAEMLMQLSEIKFGQLPAWVRRAVEAADKAQLDVWTERFMTASSAEELFG
jgi:hypothetical protein